MNIESLLKKHKILKRDLMAYAGYETRSGFNRALKNKNRRLRIRHSLTAYLIDVKCNININQLLEAIREDEKENVPSS